jgi:hypothetical protein
MLQPPVVYAGPSLSPREVEEALPGAAVRGPVCRWDLYREREKGSSIFVVLDGVFFQQEAVAPREILDVLEDGGLVVGASSMGALRAAECWPAGMVGVGTIYRLFRRGSLLSDDEVAVAFSAHGEHRFVSVPLVNVRYAASRAVRRGWMDRDAACRLVRAAEETFYTERDWPSLLARAGVDPAGDLEGRLAACDLKKADALRALRRVARWLAADPELADRPRRQEAPFEPRDGLRERAVDALDGLDPGEVRRGLADWHLLSGRATQRLLAVAAAHPELELAERLQKRARLGSLFQELQQGGQSGETAGATALQMVLFDLWVELAARENDFAEKLWAELLLSGDLEAEVLRWRAFRDAAATARRLGLAVRDRDRYLAELEIATAHGFPSWPALRETSWRSPSAGASSCSTLGSDEAEEAGHRVVAHLQVQREPGRRRVQHRPLQAGRLMRQGKSVAHCGLGVPFLLILGKSRHQGHIEDAVERDRLRRGDGFSVDATDHSERVLFPERLDIQGLASPVGRRVIGDGIDLAEGPAGLRTIDAVELQVRRRPARREEPVGAHAGRLRHQDQLLRGQELRRRVAQGFGKHLPADEQDPSPVAPLRMAHGGPRPLREIGFVPDGLREEGGVADGPGDVHPGSRQAGEPRDLARSGSLGPEFPGLDEAPVGFESNGIGHVVSLLAQESRNSLACRRSLVSKPSVKT